MEFWSWTIAVILGLSAIVSPIATTIINNHYQNKRENIKNYELAKRQALTNFIKITNNYPLNKFIDFSSEYYSALNTLYIYFDIPKSSIFYNLEDSLRNQDIIASKYELTNIVVTLSKQIAKE
ncbi:MAG: hypothetical protein HFJ59_00350 [Clostridia bacterium]|nr:hypothetical protein [Clostridia bacterium]